jgi:hypothetical protein
VRHDFQLREASCATTIYGQVFSAELWSDAVSHTKAS